MKTLALWTTCAWLGLSTLGCGHSEPAGPTPALAARPASPSLKQRYAGTYSYAGTPAEQAALKAAVESAIDGMGIATGFARSALLKRSEIRPSYTIVFDERGDVGVECPGFPPEVSPSNGQEVHLTNKYGDESEISQRFVGGALVQRGRTGDGSGETLFKLQPDERTLLVKKVMKSEKLPRPVEYTLTYLRQVKP